MHDDYSDMNMSRIKSVSYKKVTSLALLLLFSLTFSVPAFSQCVSPTADAGDIIYNKDFNTMQYCDGTNHIGMGRAPGTGAEICTIPLTQEGIFSSADLDGIQSLEIYGNFAYSVSSIADSITVIDISNPALPAQVGTLSSTDLNGATAIKISGNYAYISSISADSLTIIDISIPSTPLQVGTISNSDLNGAIGVSVSGNFAYVTSLVSDSLTIIDISTPSAPVQVGTISTPDLDGAQGIALSGNFAYVTSRNADSLTVIDISTPSAPVQVATVSNPNLDSARNLSISGNFAYVASAVANSLTVIDISTPSAPSQIGTISTPSLNEANDVTILGNNAFVASRAIGSLSVIDISTPSAPQQISSISNPDLAFASGVTVLGNLAYVAATSADALTIIDISETCTVQDGLIGYWRLDETSGTTAIDSSFNSNVGTLQDDLNFTPDSLTGVIDGGLDFDGTDDAIRIPDDPVLNPINEITISAWVNFSISGDEQIIVGKPFNDGTHVTPFFSYSLQIMNSERPRLYLDTAGSGIVTLLGDTAIPENEWHHVVGTFDGQFLRMYFNGFADAAPNDLGSQTTLNVYNTPLYIGINGGDFEEYLGQLDDVRIYDRALTAGEVTRLYNAGRDRGLVGHYKLDETTGTSGTTAVDSSPSANDGTYDGIAPATDSVPGKIGTAIDFSQNSSDHVSFSKVNDTGDVTISGWFRHNGTFASKISGMVDIATSYRFRSRFGLNSLSFFADDWTTNGGSWIRGGSPFDVGSWTHLAVTYSYNDPIGTDPLFYKNGVFIGSGTEIVAPAGSYSPSGSNVEIGGRTDTTGNNFEGEIDDVRIYNRVLSANEIQALYREKFIMCNTPDGYEGDIIYNDDNHIMQFCNADNWQGMAASAGDGGAGCAAPVGTTGDMVYNDDFDVMQFCEGDSWIGIGK
ncbi:MAG: LamG-like jellyroll fold domain-containing protein [Pseudomonadota bacterium]